MRNAVASKPFLKVSKSLAWWALRWHVGHIATTFRGSSGPPSESDQRDEPRGMCLGPHFLVRWTTSRSVRTRRPLLSWN